MHSIPDEPRQLLDREAYVSRQWFERESQELFANTWHFACMAFELPEPGDYLTTTIAGHPIFIIRDADGELSAWHNLCRHRGTELLEGTGNTGKTIVCPYHRWTYGIDGRLRGLPDRADCFPDLDRDNHHLLPIGLGVFKEMAFVNLGEPEGAGFEQWIGSLRGKEWPHEISASKLIASQPFIYDVACNWKVFCENALDGYHLAYLHENTLGGPVPAKNVWEAHGRNLVWYSTERDGLKNRIPVFVEKHAGLGASKVPGADQPGYGGVYYLFPTTLVTPSPWSLTITAMRPVGEGRLRLEARTWVPDSWLGYKESPQDAPGFDSESGTIRSANWQVHPLETGDFQTEDIWVCEKMQRSLDSPAYAIRQLAGGSGGEAALETFQRNVLDFVQ